MISNKTTSPLFNICLWVLAYLVTLVLLVSCSPLSVMDAASTTETPTRTPEVILSPTIEPTPSQALQICEVKTGVESGALNLRTGAGMNYSVIKVLSEGDHLTVIHKGTWLEVTDSKGNHGFINSKYCK